MPESIRPEKNVLAFNQGLNTESSEIAFPDGFTTDERNYELLLDGSRRRRKGLAQESGGSDKTTTNNAIGENETYTWYNVEGDPTKTFIVHKFGSELYFTDDAETISTTYHSSVIDLDNHKVTASSVSADTNAASFSSGRGRLLVTGPGHKPLLIEYSASTDEFTVIPVDLLIRDFSDQVDGIPMNTRSTTLSAALRYNLLNRGWSQTDIDAYFSGASVYPDKSVGWWNGYARQVDDSVYINNDGVKVFNHLKFSGEPATASSAPIGSMFISPIDSTYARSEGVSQVEVSAITLTTDHGSTWTIRFTLPATHGITAPGPIEVQYSTTRYYITGGVVDEFQDWSGTHTVTAVDQGGGSNVEILVDQPPSFDSVIDMDFVKGSIVTDAVITRGSGSALSVAPRVCEFHDGRAFYAGMDDEEWSDYVFFSQIPETRAKFAACYQSADPTDPENNQLTDTDGGWFAIQGIQNVKEMLSVRSSLLIFAENGVWEVSGGQRGFFTPQGYSIRKITDVGCNSPYSPISLENTAIYTGAEGIYRIAPNQYTGILEATSISIDLVQTKWNAIPSAEQKRVMTVYDGAKKRIYFLYGKSSATTYYDEILILDTRIPAYFYYLYSPSAYGIISAYTISNTDTTDQANKIKFSCGVTDATTVRTCDHSQTDYLDFDGVESPLPYAVSGWDSMGVTSGLSSRVETQRRRQAPIVTVYSKRTETGYTESGTGWSGDNESSTKMSAFWDWTEAKQFTSTARTAQETWDGTGDATKPSVSGKIDDQQQVYRHTRAFTPATATDVDGYPVVVTRNKVRGRGRVLQLRFDGEATKDSHIMGFTVNYRAQGRY